jgi:hypothetical protein
VTELLSSTPSTPTCPSITPLHLGVICPTPGARGHWILKKRAKMPPPPLPVRTLLVASLLQLAAGSPPPCSLQALGPTATTSANHQSFAATSEHCCHQANSSASISSRHSGESPTHSPCQAGSPVAARARREDVTLRCPPVSRCERPGPDDHAKVRPPCAALA